MVPPRANHSGDDRPTSSQNRAKDVRAVSSALIEVKELDIINSAVRIVSADLNSQVLDHFRIISEIGGVWCGNKTTMYWVLKAFARSSKMEISDGIKLDDLFSMTQRLANDRFPGRPRLIRNKFDSLIVNQFVLHQICRFKTPIIAYDSRSRKLIVLDSWTKFVLIANRDSIAAEF
jgi:hypothetical protein